MVEQLIRKLPSSVLALRKIFGDGNTSRPFSR